MKNRIDLQSQAEQVLERAEAKGVSTNFFFVTTFKRYQVQMRILTELEKKIAEDGPLVTKEYVKNRGNVYVNPAITEYNKTATAANGTVSTLINILKQLEDDSTGSSRLKELIDSIDAE